VTVLSTSTPVRFHQARRAAAGDYINPTQRCGATERHQPPDYLVVMGLLTLLARAFGAEDQTTAPRDSAVEPTAPDRYQCRSCGRRYGGHCQLCPDCGSGNRLRGGAPPLDGTA
jgi:hypothetical protein